MVTIKNAAEIAKMRVAGQVLGEALDMLRALVTVGTNCLALDQAFAEFITARGCQSNFQGYGGFPRTICVSINEQLIHGIPQDRVLQDGDIVKVDAGCSYQGYHADAAFTKICGQPLDANHAILVQVTEEALALAIAQIRPGTRLGTLGAVIQHHAEGHGFAVPRDYTGHGIGTQMHEDPHIPNYGVTDTGMRLQAGMTIAVEPMLQMGTHKTTLANDK